MDPVWFVVREYGRRRGGGQGVRIDHSSDIYVTVADETAAEYRTGDRWDSCLSDTADKSNTSHGEVNKIYKSNAPEWYDRAITERQDGDDGLGNIVTC